MKYYIVKYTDDLAEGFGGSTQGPFIKIRPKYEGDRGLLEHERTHVRQWYVATVLWLSGGVALTLLLSSNWWLISPAAPFLHTMLYQFVRPYRRWCEVRAYRQQIAAGGYPSKEFAVTALVEKYDLELNLDAANALLSD
jgi:hypothetical protein